MKFSVLLLCPLLAAAPAWAQVDASLVSSDRAVAPGRPLTVAIHLAHHPHWHTYWINPGTGVTTTVVWKLPPGWTAGPVQWPVPRIVADDDGNVTGLGYGDDLLLPVQLNPPAGLAPGRTAKIVATVKWLMCRDACMPGSANLTLELPVTAGDPAPDPKWQARIAQALSGMPRPDAAWAVSARRTGAATLELAVAPTGQTGASAAPGDLRFFCDDNLVGFELPQKTEPDGHGGYKITLSLATDDGPAHPNGLHGVLAASHGWHSDGTVPGLRVDTAL